MRRRVIPDVLLRSTTDRIVVRKYGPDEALTPERLSNLAVLTLGLWWMGIYDIGEMARAIGCSKGSRTVRELERLIYYLKTTDEPQIREWVDVGLPPGICAGLHGGETVLCAGCNREINIVPCPACSLAASAASQDFFGRPKRSKVRFGPVTKELPGSPGKVAILAERAKKGLALFHPRDARM